MAGTPECRKGRVVRFLASFPECGGNSAPVSVDTQLLRWLSPRAELGSGPLPVCNSSRAGSDHCHPLTSLFLFAAALPFPCPFVPQPHPGARTSARASAGTVHRESWPEICPAWPPPTAPLRAHPSAALIGCSCPTLNRQGPLTRGKFSVPGGSWTFGDSEKAAAPEAAGVWAAMEEPPLREEEEEEGDEAGPEGALGKSPFQLTAEDVYDISYVMGRELMALGSDPRVTQLQFKIVRVLEMLETLVNEGSLTMEELRMERDNLRKEVEGLRRESSTAGREVSAGSGHWQGGRFLLLNIQAPQNKSLRVCSPQIRRVKMVNINRALARCWPLCRVCSKAAASSIFDQDLEQWFSSFSLECSLKHRLPGPSCRVSDSVGLQWDLRICISHKFQDDADSLGPGFTL